MTTITWPHLVSQWGNQKATKTSTWKPADIDQFTAEENVDSLKRYDWQAVFQLGRQPVRKLNPQQKPVGIDLLAAH